MPRAQAPSELETMDSAGYRRCAHHVAQIAPPRCPHPCEGPSEQRSLCPCQQHVSASRLPHSPPRRGGRKNIQHRNACARAQAHTHARTIMHTVLIREGAVGSSKEGGNARIRQPSSIQHGPGSELLFHYVLSRSSCRRLGGLLSHLLSRSFLWQLVLFRSDSIRGQHPSPSHSSAGCGAGAARTHNTHA